VCETQIARAEGKLVLLDTLQVRVDTRKAALAQEQSLSNKPENDNTALNRKVQ